MSALSGLLLPWALVPLLIAVIYCDLRMMRIPNILPLLFLGLFAITLPFSEPFAQTLTRVAIAGGVFVLGFIGFAFRLLGGGDVKSLPAILLFVPTALMSHFMLALSAGLILGIAGLTLARLAAKGRQTGWRSLTDTKRFPMGLSFGLAGLALIAWQIQATPLA
ncbi:prepilin peptidase [Alphaproteobacteria bacterium KMM 3653]|uniref:Prepilin peptidase n=1 Tax=Harenicola maris TaxID=2841044 RepID=A0AAP2CPQ7_9RHOB|nr:prepilin peptidase [Harenicola maris]